MRNHRQFEEMVARRDELTPREEASLAAHLDICERCRDAAGSYARQDIVLRPLSWDHCSDVRRRVLAEVDKMPPKSTPRRVFPVPPATFFRRMLVRAALVTVVASAIVVNVPARETVGAASSPLGSWAWTSCNAEGYAWLNYTRILSSPTRFRGPGVIFIKSALLDAQNTISAPTYYVFPRSPSAGTCRPNTQVTDIVVAINTKTGAELHAVGSSETVPK